MIKRVLLSLMVLTTIVANAQPDRFTYAVTDIKKDGANWNFLRKLDLQTGQYSEVIFNGTDPSVLAYDAGTKKPFTSQLKDARYKVDINPAFATGVAAMAYDKRTNRLYYTPMFIDQLRYLDLRTMKVFYVTDQPFAGSTEKSSDQGNIVTRMVIGADGNGYAMTNDAAHFIKFTTGKNITITDLGGLVDDPANKANSIHSSCSSFGGDVVADDDGNLYVFSARNYTFKVNIASKVATYIGQISGLPSGFTVNGAAVNDKNQIIVASAMEASSYFTVDPKTWGATPYKIGGTVWHSSDLANSNLLVSGNKPAAVTPELLTRTIVAPDSRIQIYPNPVVNNKFVIQFSQLQAGNYTVQLVDVSGRQLQQRIVNVSGDNQTQEMNINPLAARGVYMVKVVDHHSRSVFSTKIVVQ
jgi:hypothetical protein